MSEVPHVDTSQTSPTRRPPVDADLGEPEHQALDILAELPLGDLWRAARRGDEAAKAAFAAGVEAHGEAPEDVAEALATAAPALERVSARVGRSLIDAAASLARSPEAGPLTATMVAEAGAALDGEPRLAATLVGVRETVGLCLALAPDSVAAAQLDALGAGLSARRSSAWARFAAALDDRIHAAWPRDEQPGPTPAALRVFRSASVIDAGPDVRARALAADDPEQLALAEALVARLADPAELVARFEQARAEAEARGAQPASTPEEPAMDGPKRRFTAGHLILALVILALTLWHYVWR